MAALALIGVLVAAQVLSGAAGLGAHFWPGMQRPSIASTVQSNVRWNTFIGLSLAQSLLGREGVALMVVACAGMIPTANLISISVFEAYGPRRVSLRRKLLSIVGNPFILACIVGVGLGLGGVGVPPALLGSLDIVAASAIAIGLLTAGAAIDFRAMGTGLTQLLVWSLLRLLLLPLLVVAFTHFAGVSGLARSVAIIAAATPTAVNGVILARQMHGDAEFAANLTALQTLLSIMTIPLLLVVFDAV